MRYHAEFLAASERALEPVRGWLTERALEHERPSLLFAEACAELRRRRIERPAVNRVMRLVAWSPPPRDDDTRARPARPCPARRTDRGIPDTRAVYAMEILSRAGREMRDVVRGASNTHLHLRDRLVAVVIISVLVDLVASVAIFFLERTAPRSEIRTMGDALFWTSTQLLTVSSQLRNPISTGARILDIALQAYAISVVAALAGSFGSFFHRRGRERDEAAAASAAEAPG